MAVPQEIPWYALDRPALRGVLDEAVRGPVTTVVAPAGSGKSILLAQWATEQTDRRVAWIDLEPADNDPARLLRRVAQALELPEAAVRAVLPAVLMGGGTLGADASASLVAALRDLPPHVLILDDVHRLTSTALLSGLLDVAERAYPSMAVILSARLDPLLRDRARRLLHGSVEIRQSDLALTPDETGRLLARLAGTPAADPSVVDSVAARTEGWVAAVQMTGMALRHRTDPKAFASQLVETDRVLADYLGEEVLSAVDPDLRRHLLEMSALDRHHPALLEEVLGVTNGTELLEDLHRRSMFIIPLDERGEWVRFHHLFRELMRYRLRASAPAREREILGAAAEWYVERGDPEAAIGCLLDAGEWTRALDVVLTRGRQVYESAQVATVAGWIARVPPEILRGRPEARVLWAMLQGMSGAAAPAEDTLREVLAEPDVDAGLRIVAHAYIGARVQFRAGTSVAGRAATHALELLRTDPDVPIPSLLGLTSRDKIESLAAVSLARAHLHRGSLGEARELLQRTLDGESALYSPYRVHALGSLALAEACGGFTAAAAAHADEALALAREAGLLVHAAPADAYLARALVGYERGEEDTGRSFALHEGMARAQSNHRTQLMWFAIMTELECAGNTSYDIPDTDAPPLVSDRLVARCRRLAREGQDTPDLPGMSALEPVRGWSRTRAEDVARALAARDVLAATLLLEAIESPSEQVDVLACIEHRLLQAWLASLRGRRDLSDPLVAGALELARPHHLVAVFTRRGPEVAGLIRELPTPRDAFREHIEAMLPTAGAPAASGADASTGLEGSLTARERELLAYLPTRLSNADLADRWYVSVNTIKTHLAHIYRKLGVTGRDEAVEKARALGIL